MPRNEGAGAPGASYGRTGVVGQTFFWTVEWQAGEAEALRGIAAGDVRHFTTGADAVAWLLADDDLEPSPPTTGQADGAPSLPTGAPRGRAVTASASHPAPARTRPNPRTATAPHPPTNTHATVLTPPRRLFFRFSESEA